MPYDYDILVIGGGINGVGVASDLAGRNLKVILIEQNDLGSGTSSASSRLINGGLRYLENYEFKQVRESLLEQKRLLRNAAHLVTPQEFILPVHKKLRPMWMLRLGLWLYDHLLFKKTLPKSKKLAKSLINTLGIKQEFSQGLSYYDCKVDDSRLVVHVALQAREHHAKILTRHKVIDTLRMVDHWQVSILDINTKQQFMLKTKMLINAAGPYVDQVNSQIIKYATPKYRLSLIKGSHIIVPKLSTHDKAFILQNYDKRVVFVIPFLKQYHLIGTTDEKIDTLTSPLSISEHETEYLCKLVNEFFQIAIHPQDVISSYAGVRPLISSTKTNNPSKISRDFKIEVNSELAPLIVIYGGKLTTYRRLAHDVSKRALKFFPNAKRGDWTKKHYLPGGDITQNTLMELKQKYGFLSTELLEHYFNNFGTRTYQVLGESTTMAELGRHFGKTLYQIEINYLIKHEWVQNAQDLLWRRGKLGLSLSVEETQAVADYIDRQLRS
jgi:glycerol-3-phosphate dehydrogenase